MISSKKIRILMAVFSVMAIFEKANASTVVIESNRGDANSLLTYDLGAGGILKAGPQIPTQGKGIVDPTLALGPFDSDQQIITNAAKTLLFAVNSGSNSIAVFKMGKGGALVPAEGSPFDSHGINPVSVGIHGDTLVVVNKHQDPAQNDGGLPNYTTFKIDADGKLKWTGSSVDVAVGSSPSQALISKSGPFVFGADFLGGLLESFVLGLDGSLHRSSSFGVPATAFANAQAPRFPLGLAVHPKHSLIYAGLPTTNRIAIFSYNAWGKMSYKNVVNDSGTAVCWLTINASGTRLYASNTADPSITVYDISANPASPTEIEKLVLSSAGGAYQLSLSPDEKNLVVITQRFKPTTPQGQGNEIHTLSVDQVTGKVQESASPTILNLPVDTRPQGVAIF